jgi:hypothetical protein
MRKLIFILFLFSSVQAQQKITLTIGKPLPISGLVDNTIIYTSPTDAKGYPAFASAPSPLSDGSLVTGFKKSADHASQGDFAIVKSTNGGLTSSLHYVRTASGIVQTSMGTFYRDAVSGYLYALTVDANTSGNSPNFLKVDTYRILESSFIADPDANWTQTTTVNFNGYASGMVISDLWGAVLKMPSGKIRVPISLRNTSTTRHIALFIESTDDGATWTIGSTPILDITATGTFPSTQFSEVNPVIVENGATDATTKIVVLIRNESYALWTHVKSSDGGTTWTQDNTYNFGYYFSDISPISELNYGSPQHIPVCSILHDGTMYSVIGYRGTSSGTNKDVIAVMSMSVSEFFNNPQPKTTVTVTALKSGTQIYNNVLNGDQIHFGYPELFHWTDGSLWLVYYDEYDPTSAWVSDGNPKTRLIILKVAD